MTPRKKSKLQRAVEMKPSERIIEIMQEIKREAYPTKMFPNFYRSNKMMSHLRWLAVMQYLDEQAIARRMK